MVGAKLDRNGLRPMRYALTSDGLLVVGSEVGLADLRDKQIIERNRLGPGEILLVDSLAGAIFRNNNEVAELLGPDGLRDVSRNRLSSRQRSAATVPPSQDAVTHLAPTATFRHASEIEPQKLAAALGWTEDQFRLLFQPLGRKARKPSGAWATTRLPRSFPPSAADSGITASSVSPRSRTPRSIRCAKFTSCR